MANNELRMESSKPFRICFVIAKKTIILLFFLCLPFVNGCGGPSPREIAEIELMISLGIVVFSWFVIVLLTLLTRRLNLVRSIIFSMQYAFFTVLGIVLMVLLYYDEAIRTVVLGAILGIPYLFLSTAALLLILPQNLLLYLPSFVLMPHFAMSALLYVTNSDFLFKIQPIILTLILWPFTTAAIVILLIILFVQRKHVTNSITQKEPDKG